LPGKGALALDNYKVLICHARSALSDKEAAVIRAWVQRGGTLITGNLPAGRL